MPAKIDEVKDEIYRDIENSVKENSFIVEAGSPEALQRFETFACARIAAAEVVDVKRIRLFGLRFAADGRAIVFNGYQIMPA